MARTSIGQALLGLGHAGVDEEQPRPAVGDHAGEGLGRRGRGQGRDRDAGPQRAQEQRRIGDRRQGADGHGLALGDPIAPQGGGDPVGQGVELGVGDGLAGLHDDRRVAGPLGGPLAQDVAHHAVVGGHHVGDGRGHGLDPSKQLSGAPPPALRATSPKGGGSGWRGAPIDAPPLGELSRSD
jgi:hypothetical protein